MRVTVVGGWAGPTCQTGSSPALTPAWRPGGSPAELKEAGAGGLPDSDKLLCKGPLSDPVP